MPLRLNRGRRATACDACFTRKIQCDANVPRCNWCEHRNLTCTFRRRGRGEPENNAENCQLIRTRRIEKLEAIVAQRLLNLDNGNTISWQSVDLTAPVYTLFSTCPLDGNLWFSDEGQEWFASWAGTKITSQIIRSFGCRWHNPRSLYLDFSAPTRDLISLPSRPVVEHYASLFCSSYQSLVFPIVSQALFTATLDLTYSFDGKEASSIASSSTYAFLALISLFGIDDNTSNTLDFAKYHSAAESLVSVIMKRPTIDGLQALVSIIILNYFMGDLQAAESFTSLASCLYFQLEADITPKAGFQSEESIFYNKTDSFCHFRDLFWVCYSFDKDLALRTGHPPAFNDRYCNLTMPPRYLDLHDENILRTDTEVSQETVPLYPWDIRLSQIKARTYDKLYSRPARDQSASELLECIRILDEDLELWRQSLRSDYRPTLTFTEETPVTDLCNTQAVMLHLSYYHCMTTIHRASIRCTSSAINSDSNARTLGLRSSLALLVDASRSSLLYVRKFLPKVRNHCFWVVLFYPLSAILSIFSHLLTNPLDANADMDLDALRDIPILLQKIPVYKAELAEIIHLKFINAFGAELARLAGCNVEQARSIRDWELKIG